MTPEQFEALATLCRLRQSASREAARLVLVGNLPLGDAAAQAGITLQGASQAVIALRRALGLARSAVG